MTKNKFPFLGEFQFNSKTYTVTKDCYDEVPTNQSDEDRIKGAKYIAILKAKNKAKGPDPFIIDEDTIERFLGDILIFDANNLAHRCRHVYNLSNLGQDVSVTYGVLNVMSSIMRQYKTVCVVICWDGGVPKYRYERVPSYKNRDHSDDETYEDFIRQVKELDEEMLPVFGVSSVQTHGCEADDLIYSVSRMLHSDYRKIIVSSDMDLLQCIRYDTIVHSPAKDLEISNENFKDVVGIDRNEFLVYRCMVGDSSDGVPGIKGIGEKTALKLLEQYGASPSNLVNVANGTNSEVEPMSDSTASKIRKFGLNGFQDVMMTIRLDYDLCGNRLSLLSQFKEWQPYDHKEVKNYLMTNSFVSLMKSEFYNLFKVLRGPASLLEPEIGYKLRMPAITPVREPLEMSDD